MFTSRLAADVVKLPQHSLGINLQHTLSAEDEDVSGPPGARLLVLDRAGPDFLGLEQGPDIIQLTATSRPSADMRPGLGRGMRLLQLEFQRHVRQGRFCYPTMSLEADPVGGRSERDPDEYRL